MLCCFVTKFALLTLIMKLIKENENDGLNFKCLPTEKVYSQVCDLMKCSGILSCGVFSSVYP